jgi:hypothetical protein
MTDTPTYDLIPRSQRALRKTRSLALGFGLMLTVLFAVGGQRASAQMFNLTTNAPITIPSGHFGTLTATVTPVSSISGTVNLYCSNLPANAFCVFPNSDAALTVNNAPATINITINTSAVNQYEGKKTFGHHGAASVALCSLLAPAALLFFAFRKRKSAMKAAMGVTLSLLGLVSMVGLGGCASTKPANVAPGTYTVVLHASYSTIATSTNFTLIVD